MKEHLEAVTLLVDGYMKEHRDVGAVQLGLWFGGCQRSISGMVQRGELKCVKVRERECSCERCKQNEGHE